MSKAVFQCIWHVVPYNAVVICQGQPKQWCRVATNGREVICSFCGDCGTRLFQHCLNDFKPSRQTI